MIWGRTGAGTARKRLESRDKQRHFGKTWLSISQWRCPEGISCWKYDLPLKRVPDEDLEFRSHQQEVVGRACKVVISLETKLMAQKQILQKVNKYGIWKGSSARLSLGVALSLGIPLMEGEQVMTFQNLLSFLFSAFILSTDISFLIEP